MVENENDVILYIKHENILKELNRIKTLIFKEFKNSTNLIIADNNDLNNLCKIAIQYDTEMLQLKKDEIGVDFDYLYLGPEFLVSSTQPALGMVYKIMEMNSLPCIKFSEEKDKQTIPASKSVYRLFDSNNNLIGDYLNLVNENQDFINRKSVEAL